jgi:hypothetical protein
MRFFVKREIVFEGTKMRGCSRVEVSLNTRVITVTEFKVEKPFSQNWKKRF